MLAQLLVTAVVLVIVLLVTRARRSASQPPAAARPPARRFANRALAGYALLGLLVLGALLVFYLQWQHAHQVMTVRVVDGGSGQATVYHVYRKDLGGREFQTLDGRQVSLGAGDRMELSER